MSTTKQRYRPVLSADEIKYLDKLVKESYISGMENPNKSLVEQNLELSIMQKLATFIAKIDAGAKTPAYTMAEKQSLEESLGMVVTQDTETKEEYWERCYNKFIRDSTSCTIEELNAANEHRYLNDLMTPDEIANYERNMGL